jgi:hypothetical protein
LEIICEYYLHLKIVLVLFRTWQRIVRGDNRKDYMNFTPMKAHGTIVYINGGGFDVRHCPDPVGLASLIVTACNEHADRLAARQDQKHEIDLLRRHLADTQQELASARELLAASTDAMVDASQALADGEAVQGQLVAALMLAQVALTHSEAKARVYDEPVKRHADALAAVNAALASAGATQ